MENLNQAELTAFEKAIQELRTVKSVDEWNEVRAKHRDNLSQNELAAIDGNGLITQVLGSGK